MKYIFLIFLVAMNLSSTQNKSIRYLALGDSYTIGESVSEADRWPNQLAEAMTAGGKAVEKPTIIATTGWRTDNLKNAINIAKLPSDFDLVSLLIGVNNQYQGKPIAQFKLEFRDLLQTAIALAGGKKENVFVVSIPDYGYTPFGKPRQKQISAELDEYNEASRVMTEELGVRYRYITDISRRGLDDPELVAPDGLHPSGKMYRLWVERIMEKRGSR